MSDLAMDKSSTPRALAGIRVLDLSRVLAAPLAAQWLGDLGADVIKIGASGKRRRIAHLWPAVPHRPRWQYHRHCGILPVPCNRSKKSVTVDHSTPEGQALIATSPRKVMWFWRTFRAGALKKYNLDYASLALVNPRLVYCSVTGFGQDGPYAKRPGYDGIFQAMGGFDERQRLSGRTDEGRYQHGGYPHQPLCRHRHPSGTATTRRSRAKGSISTCPCSDCSLASLRTSP